MSDGVGRDAPGPSAEGEADFLGFAAFPEAFPDACPDEDADADEEAEGAEGSEEVPDASGDADAGGPSAAVPVPADGESAGSEERTDHGRGITADPEDTAVGAPPTGSSKPYATPGPHSVTTSPATTTANGPARPAKARGPQEATRVRPRTAPGHEVMEQPSQQPAHPAFRTPPPDPIPGRTGVGGV
ncbi:hypothetical protein [Streptomyces sp. NPDC093568]|uniref:hypothetical protein n=1 Tax=Streptomyces sp. NPDC093568 TaxID=3366041 RepID=UPI003820C19D